MSTELNEVPEQSTSPAISMTSFFGGIERGRCVQLTQSHRTPEGFAAHGIPAQSVALTRDQAERLICELSIWLDGASA